MFKLRSKLLHLTDSLLHWRDYLIIRKFTQENYRYQKMAICGGGNSLSQIQNCALNETFIASCNYTRLSQYGVRPHVIMLSDPEIFSSKLLPKTLKHISTENPTYILLPTRIRWFPVVMWRLRSHKKIFVRFYGPALWTDDVANPVRWLHDVLPRYDSVAFEFGYPLAKTLNVQSVYLFGVDLRYGAKEDDSDFRINWRGHIKKSLLASEGKLPFCVYKGSGEKFNIGDIQ